MSYSYFKFGSMTPWEVVKIVANIILKAAKEMLYGCI